MLHSHPNRQVAGFTMALALLSAFSTVASAGLVIPIEPVMDSYIDGGAKTTNFGSQPYVEVNYRELTTTIFNTRVNSNSKTYLRFDLSGPRDPHHVKLTFTLEGGDVLTTGTTNARKNPYTFMLYGVNNDDGALEAFTEGGLTWNNAPANIAAPVNGVHQSPFLDIGSGPGQATFLGSAVMPGSSADQIARGDQLIFDTTTGNLQALLDFLKNPGADQAVTLILVKQVGSTAIPPLTAEQYSHRFFSTESTDLDAIPPMLEWIFVPEPATAALLLTGLTLVGGRRRRARSSAGQ